MDRHINNRKFITFFTLTYLSIVGFTQTDTTIKIIDTISFNNEKVYVFNNKTWEFSNVIEKINYLKTTLFLNNGSGFELVDLPYQVQFSPNFDICVGDVNADGNEDIFLSQNYFSVYNNNSRNDSGLGLLLLGRGNGKFDYVSSNLSGLKLYGEQRGASFTDFNNDGKSDLIVSQLGVKISLYRNTFPRKGILVKLKTELVGSELRLIYNDGSKGPKRIARSTSEVLGKEKQADYIVINMNNKISKRVKIDNKSIIYIK